MIDGIIRQRKKRGFRSPNLAQPVERPGVDIESVVIVHIVSDGEHRISGGCRSSRLHQLNVAVSVAEVVSVNTANPPIV